MIDVYRRLRRHYRDLPDLPDPSEAATWTPDDPAAVKSTIERFGCWGYVPPALQDRLEELTAPPPPPDPAEVMKRKRREFEWAKTQNRGPVVRKIGDYAIAWNAPVGWTPERYQVVARSQPRYGSEPLYDDPFHYAEIPDETEPGGIRYVRRPRLTWTSVGGYEPGRGPIRSPRSSHEVPLSLLEPCGPGPWQVAVLGWWEDMGGVIGNVVELGTATPNAAPGAVDPELPRWERILAHVRAYEGPRLRRNGAPYVVTLRKRAGMRSITAAERNRAWREVRG